MAWGDQSEFEFEYVVQEASVGGVGGGVMSSSSSV